MLTLENVKTLVREIISEFNGINPTMDDLRTIERNFTEKAFDRFKTLANIALVDVGSETTDSERVNEFVFAYRGRVGEDNSDSVEFAVIIKFNYHSITTVKTVSWYDYLSSRNREKIEQFIRNFNY